MAGKLQHAHSSRKLAAYIVLYTKGRESGEGGYYAKPASTDVLPLARLCLLKVPHPPQTPSGDHVFTYIVIYAIIKARNVTEKDKRKSNMQHK